MAIGEWLVLLLSCGAAVVGLLLAASEGGDTTFVLGFGLFAVAVIYTSVFVKRHFDRLDRMGR
ncbi:MAG: hypothetical protein WDN25_31125 [Acetobacteraceae bacterium]